MRAPLRFLAVVSFAGFATAQSSFDPYQLAGKKDLHTADLNQLWRTLGISGKIRETTATGSRDTDASFNCGSDSVCDAESFLPDWPLLADGGDDMVVRISVPSIAGDLSRFLLLHQERADGPWQLVDYLDSEYSHYARAEASVVYSGGKRWLVLTSSPRCGTGCFLEPADWFELKNGKLRMILTVPRSGHDGNQSLGRYFETRFLRARQSEGRETLEFLYHVEFRPGFGSRIKAGTLWDEEKVIRFFRPAGQSEFKFDPKNSEASQAYVEDIFSTDLEVTQPRLFVLVQDHLLEIARGPHNRRREWLKELLETYPDAPQLAPVREAFAKTP